MVTSRRASAECGAAPQCGKGEDRSSLQAVRDGPGRLRCHQGSGCLFDTPWIPPEMEEVVEVVFRCNQEDRSPPTCGRSAERGTAQARAIEPGPGNRRRDRSCSGRIPLRAARPPSRSIMNNGVALGIWGHVWSWEPAHRSRSPPTTHCRNGRTGETLRSVEPPPTCCRSRSRELPLPTDAR